MWTSAAFARQLPPAPCATAPAPRQGGHATVATRASATVAPSRWRRSTGSYVQRTPVKRAALLPDFDNALDGRLMFSFPFSKPHLLLRTTMTRANWRVAKINNPPGHAVPLVNDQVEDSAALPMSLPTNESVEGNDKDDASSTARWEQRSNHICHCSQPTG